MKTNQNITRTIILFLGIILPFTTIGLSDCGPDPDPTPKTTKTTNFSGTILEGPVTSATIITSSDADGKIVITNTKGNDDATFTLAIPDGTTFPIKITVTDGTDKVTEKNLGFQLTSIITDKNQTTTNISPLTTIIYEAATTKAGGTLAEVSKANVEDVTKTVLNNFGFGIDAEDDDFDPLTTKITSNNLASSLKASEAAGELVRRIAGTNAENQALIFSALGKDLADGDLDGKQDDANLPSASLPKDVSPNEFVASTSLQSAIISAEVVSNNLEVTKNNGNKMTSSKVQSRMQASMEVVAPSLSDSEAASKLSSLTVSSQLKAQGQAALEASINIVGSGTNLDALKTIR